MNKFILILFENDINFSLFGLMELVIKFVINHLILTLFNVFYGLQFGIRRRFTSKSIIRYLS